MSDKIKVWKCEECFSDDWNGCVIFKNPMSDDPNTCVHHHLTSSWKKTSEYEIVKKPQKITTYFKMKDCITPELEKLTAKIKQQTPNCAVCEWRVKNTYKEIFSKEVIQNHKCSAQADWELSEVYNSPECQKLFTDKNAPEEITGNPV